MHIFIYLTPYTHRLEKLPAPQVGEASAPGTVTPHSSPVRSGQEAPACTPTHSTAGPREVTAAPSLSGTASERRVNRATRFKDFYVKAKARIWP